MNSLYENLQVTADASPEVIRAAYKSLSAKYHPDRDASTEAAKQFAQVQEAFQTLSDPARRERYDAELSTNVNSTHTFENVVFRVDGTSSHLTLEEHLKRGGRELTECDLSGLRLDGVSFRGANLTKSKLDGSSFVGCDFRQVNLTDCSARNCKFSGAFFGGAQIHRTDFSGSSMRGVAFFGANALWKSTCKRSDARFTEWDDDRSIVDKTLVTGQTTIKYGNFTQCDLTETQFAPPAARTECTSKTETILGVVERQVTVHFKQEFTPCTVVNSRFSKANMAQCDLHGISLKGSVFEETVLNGANLKGANIEGIHFAACSVTNLDLHEATYSDDTILPSGFRLPENSKRISAVPLLPASNGNPQQDDTNGALMVLLIIVVVIATCLALAARFAVV